MYFQYNILYHASISSFFHCLLLRLNFFLKIRCKTEQLLLIKKKVGANFDKK